MVASSLRGTSGDSSAGNARLSCGEVEAGRWVSIGTCFEFDSSVCSSRVVVVVAIPGTDGGVPRHRIWMSEKVFIIIKKRVRRIYDSALGLLVARLHA